MPSADDSRIDPEALLARTAWLRSLAVSLVGHQSADDLVQDTWLTALQAGPRSTAALPGWLGRVMQNLSYRGHRQSVRRRRREERVARPMADGPPASRLVEDLELQKALVEAVLELSEPYRSTVVLRYYHECGPSEIAALAGISTDTVHTRIRRAHAQLRSKLERAFGQRARDLRGFLAPLLPLSGLNDVATAAPAVSGATLTTVIGGIMGLKSKLMLVAALLLLVSLLSYWHGVRTGRTSQLEDQTEALLGADTPESTLPAQSQGPSDSEAESSTPAVTTTPTTATVDSSGRVAEVDLIGIVVYGQVTDSRGEPIERARVSAEDSSGNVRYGHTGAGPGYSVFGLEPGSWVIRAAAPGCSGLDEPLEIPPASGSIRRDLSLTRHLALPVTIVTPTGEPFADWLKKEGLKSSFPFPRAHALDVIAIVTSGKPGPELPLTPLRDYSRSALSEYFDTVRSSHLVDKPKLASDGLLHVKQALPVYVSAAVRHVILDTQLVTEDMDGVRLVVDPDEYLHQLGSVRLRPVDSTGDVVASATALLNDYQSMGGFPTRVENGEIHFASCAPGILKLEVLAKGYGAVHRTITVDPGSHVDLGDLVLHPGRSISGTICNEQGIGLSCRVVHFPMDRGIDFFWYGRGYGVTTENDGSFVIPRLGPGRYLLRPEIHDAALTTQIVDIARDSVTDIRVIVEAGTPVTLRSYPAPLQSWRITIRDSTGKPVLGVLLPNGRGDTERFQLRPGDYTVETEDATGKTRRTALAVKSQPVTLAVPLEE